MLRLCLSSVSGASLTIMLNFIYVLFLTIRYKLFLFKSALNDSFIMLTSRSLETGDGLLLERIAFICRATQIGSKR